MNAVSALIPMLLPTPFEKMGVKLPIIEELSDTSIFVDVVAVVAVVGDVAFPVNVPVRVESTVRLDTFKVFVEGL